LAVVETVQPKYGYRVVTLGDHTEVRYDRAGGGSGVVSIYADKISVGGKDYAMEHIGGIFAKIPDFIMKEAGHVPDQNLPRNPLIAIFVLIGRVLGFLDKKSQMRRANEAQWTVWFMYGEEEVPLAWGFGQKRAEALERVFSQLIRA
jgi:hypothetical protein